MSPELDKKLCEKYPKIFRDRNAPMNQTCMCWGMEVGDGWYHLLDVLCTALTYSYTTSKDLDADGRIRPEGMKYDDPEWDSYQWKHSGCGQVIADQVKEKFGTLRFYYHSEWSPEDQLMAEKYPKTARIIADEQSRYMDGIIHMAETMSGMTCEVSGMPGEMHVTGGWYCTLSRGKAAELNAEKGRNYVACADLPKEKDEEDTAPTV
jgi:hypothetical protein